VQLCVVLTVFGHSWLQVKSRNSRGINVNNSSTYPPPVLLAADPVADQTKTQRTGNAQPQKAAVQCSNWLNPPSAAAKHTHLVFLHTACLNTHSMPVAK
jgi:hypothetical protein